MLYTPTTDFYYSLEQTTDWLTISKVEKEQLGKAGPLEPEQERVGSKEVHPGAREDRTDLEPVEVLEQVLKVTGCGLKDVYKKIPGPNRNAVRMLAAWWMVVGTGLSKTEVAKRLKMSNAAVGRAIRRVRTDHIRNPATCHPCPACSQPW